MNRSLFLGFLSGILFAAGIAAGAFGLDVVRDDGDSAAVLLAAGGDVIPLIAGEPGTGAAGFTVDGAYGQTEVVGEYMAVTDLAGESAESAGLGDATSDGAGDGGPFPVEPPFEGTAEGLPEGLAPVDLLVAGFEYPFFRFLDFCADIPGDPICPFGVGGTVLAPVDDDLGSIGEFDLSDTLYGNPSESWYRCEDPSDLGEDDNQLMLLANHPARIEVTYYPRDTPSDRMSVVIDETVPSRPEFGRFLDTVAATGGPAESGDRVHHCFVLHGGPRARAFTIEASATSFSGETDSAIYSYTTPDRRDRPPVIVSPITDNRLVVVVPVRADGQHSDLVYALSAAEGATCADIERGVATRSDRRQVVSPPGVGYLTAQEMISADVLDSPGWRHDPAFNRRDFWTLNLEEGSQYLLCIYWVRSPTRSFDSATVVEREVYAVGTPDRLRAAISVVGISAPTAGDLGAGSFTLEGCHASLSLPRAPLARGTGTTFDEGLPLCALRGATRHFPITEIAARFADGGVQRFAVATPNTGVPRTELVRLSLSREASGLCGSSFGACDPPRSTIAGPMVLLEVEFSDGPTSGETGWSIGALPPQEPAADEPEALPDQIRLDAFNSDVIPMGRDQLQVTAAFDRPVRITADLIGDPSGLCFSGEPPAAYVSSSLQSRHQFLISGLCPFTSYSVSLIATDEAGNTTVYAPDASTRPGALGWVAGTERTDGYRTRILVGYGWRGGDALGRVQVQVAGAPTLELEEGCLSSRNSSPIEIETGESLTARITVRVVDASRRGDECEANGRPPHTWTASVVATFTIDELQAGRVHVPVPLEPAAPGTPPPPFPNTQLDVVISPVGG